MRVEVKPKAKFQKAEGGGGETSPLRARARAAALPARHTRRGVVTPGRPEEGAGPGRAFPAFPASPAPPAPCRSRLSFPLPPPHWAPSARGCLRRLASRRPGPARPGQRANALSCHRRRRRLGRWRCGRRASGPGPLSVTDGAGGRRAPRRRRLGADHVFPERLAQEAALPSGEPGRGAFSRSVRPPEDFLRRAGPGPPQHLVQPSK